MTSAAPEPTDEHMRSAMDALGWDKSWDLFDLSCSQRAEVARVARALAAAVTAERKKYLQVAEEYEQAASMFRRAASAEEKRNRREELEASALDYEHQGRRIREVSR